MTNELLVGGVPLDLDGQTAIFPSFQANDLTKPDTIQSDFSPEFTVPGSQRNHQLLGLAAYDSSIARVPYRKLMAVLKADGVEIMPLALLYVKGYQGGRYQLQLFAGNRRFIQELGDRTLQDLDFSRFDHFWTFEAVAQRLPLSYWQDHGFGYEFYDRARQFNVESLSPFLCLPSVSYRLLWEQMLQETGFTATDLSADPLYRALNVPAPKLAGYPKDYLEARRFVGGHPPAPIRGDGRPAARDAREWPVPFTFHPAGVDPYRTPTAPVLVERSSPENYAYSVYVADVACLVSGMARVSIDLHVEFGRVAAKISAYKNGVLWIDGTAQEVGSNTNNHLVTATVTLNREPLEAGDEIHFVLRVEPKSLIYKWGWYLGLFPHFDQADFPGFRFDTPDQVSLEIVSEVPPGGRVSLAAWLPPIKLVDVFKCMVQLLGLTVQCDTYENHLYLGLSGDVLGNVSRALDWTAKRDQPTGPAGEPRQVVYRFGSYAQRNWLRWTDDPTLSVGFQGAPRRSVSGDTLATGYGDGYLTVDDANLDAEASLGQLPFAASEASAALGSVLKIPTWKRSESGSGISYEQQDVVPRLTLRSGAALAVTLADGGQTQEVNTVLSTFADPLAPVDLDLHRTVLPRYWAGLRAMLTDARFHKERYRLSAVDIARLDYTVPIWDGVLKGYFAISRISEFSPGRPTEVELCRLHPSFLVAPTGSEAGQEFWTEEFYNVEFF